MIRLAIYQPEIPQNTGTMLRMATCLGINTDIIEPCGFSLSDAKLRRAGMDYLERSNFIRHVDVNSFMELCAQQNRRTVLITPHAKIAYCDFQFQNNDTLMVGRESNGFSLEISEKIIDQIRIPMIMGERSLNVAVAAGIVVSEALRQLFYIARSENYSNIVRI